MNHTVYDKYPEVIISGFDNDAWQGWKPIIAAVRQRLSQQKNATLTIDCDPGVWGGQWMKNTFDLDPTAPNYAWCFDCVPEENSLLLRFGHVRIEIPLQDLFLLQPRALPGDLRAAANDDARFVNPLPAIKHDHFLIHAGIAVTDSNSPPLKTG